ncbi:MAG TPA: hypothetical protein VGR95_21905 [Thermoanaerobaculia bacterium]|jgi:hypothetical protein|nr:hypothetical protein [Thermoanaerobaculia bacterium]
MEDNSRLKQRKPYQKPEASRFPLRPDEAVLGFCKTTSGGGPFQAHCSNNGGCKTPGS